MLGLQYSRTLSGPTPPSPPESLERNTPPSRERLGLRSLLHHRCSPSVRPGSRNRSQRREEVGEGAMSGTYGSFHQPQSLPPYSNGTYGSAMAAISSQKSMNNHNPSWPSFQSGGSGYQVSQTSLSTSQGQSRAASPEFETQPQYGADGYSKSSSSSSIHPYLQLPPTISTGGGSISEFAAQVGVSNWR